MLKPSVGSAIRLRGVRQNNLKNFDLDLPLNQLIVITGQSGSGKSSLAFDTLFAEGQRRYIETFSPYARQFFDRMDKPQVDTIEGIPPAIAIEQRNAVKTTRSTVGTMTEICDYLKMLWPHVARLHCRQCGRLVRPDPPQAIWESLAKSPAPDGLAGSEVLVTFDLPLTDKLSLDECLALVAKQGYQRLLVNGGILRLEEVSQRLIAAASRAASLTVVQDRVKLVEGSRARLVEACEQAYHFGKGRLAIRAFDGPESAVGTARPFSNRRHCATCDIEYREPSPALFSFNHPVGACPACKGFGRIISIDYRLAIPDRSRTLAQGVVKPWQTGLGRECQADMMRMCRHFEVPTDIPFQDLPKQWQDFVIDGEPGYGQDEEHEWPRAWYGVKGYFRWLESKAYKMHVRVLLSRYRAYTPCPSCGGRRFQPEALLYRSVVPGPASVPPGASPAGLTLAEFYQLPIRDALNFATTLAKQHRGAGRDAVGLILEEVCARLGYLSEVGLGYLTLDRPTRSLSGGETERVNLTTCLGTRLVNTLFVLDEPSVGLHPRDTERLVGILKRLRQAGNTVVVVEHEASVMRAADQIVDLGPGHGAAGGQVVFQGPYQGILRAPASLTGQYLSGHARIDLPSRRPVARRSLRSTPGGAAALNEAPRPYWAAVSDAPVLRLTHATRHNLQDVSVEIPLGRFVCVTGVSGSGKTTLVREILLPAVSAALKAAPAVAKASDRLGAETESGAEAEDADAEVEDPGLSRLSGADQLGRVVLVDQSILAKTPRSNPAVYIGAFDDIRELFASAEIARQRGLNASAFSFNSGQGQCERCRGAGFEKIEMQFLSDVFIRCPDCNGRRYRAHILDIQIAPGPSHEKAPAARSLSIADLLECTVDEAIGFLRGFTDSKAGQRAVESLRWLQDVGLGYLKLGQPINTLSGGESQRLKLVRHLTETLEGPVSGPERRATSAAARPAMEPARLPTLFLFDEPTTGLHFEDVRVLLQTFQRLVDAGHSVLVIEHNLEVIKSADWVIDLGPDAGDQGGRVTACGTPEEIAAFPGSHTGTALRSVLVVGRQPNRTGKAESRRPGQGKGRARR